MSDSYCVALIFFSFKISMEDFYYYHRTISPTEAYAQVNWNSAWCYFCVLLTEVWYTWMTVSPWTWSRGEQESTMSPKLKLWTAFFQETWHQQPPPGHERHRFFSRKDPPGFYRKRMRTNTNPDRVGDTDFTSSSGKRKVNNLWGRIRGTGYLKR